MISFPLLAPTPPIATGTAVQADGTAGFDQLVGIQYQLDLKNQTVLAPLTDDNAETKADVSTDEAEIAEEDGAVEPPKTPAIIENPDVKTDSVPKPETAQQTEVAVQPSQYAPDETKVRAQPTNAALEQSTPKKDQLGDSGGKNVTAEEPILAAADAIEIDYPPEKAVDPLTTFPVNTAESTAQNETIPAVSRMDGVVPPQSTLIQNEASLPLQTSEHLSLVRTLEIPKADSELNWDIRPQPDSVSHHSPGKTTEVLNVNKAEVTVKSEPSRPQTRAISEPFSAQLFKVSKESSAPEIVFAKVPVAESATAPVVLQPLRAISASVQPTAETQFTPSPHLSKSPIVRQVMDQLVQYPIDGGVATIRLKPHGMGVIEISVDRAKDGGLNVDMRVQNPLVLDAMRTERGTISHLFQSTGTNASGTLSMDLFHSGTGREEQHRHNQSAQTGSSSGTQDDINVSDESEFSNQNKHLHSSSALNILT